VKLLKLAWFSLEDSRNSSSKDSQPTLNEQQQQKDRTTKQNDVGYKLMVSSKLFQQLKFAFYMYVLGFRAFQQSINQQVIEA